MTEDYGKNTYKVVYVNSSGRHVKYVTNNLLDAYEVLLEKEELQWSDVFYEIPTHGGGRGEYKIDVIFGGR